MYILMLLLFVGTMRAHQEPPRIITNNIAQGVFYTQYTYTNPALSIHLLSVDTQFAEVLPTHAGIYSIDRESVSTLSRRYQALAAVNGGFFRRGGAFNGSSLGILKIGSAWYSDPQLPRATIAWNAQSSPIIDRFTTACFLTLGECTVPVDRINQPLGINELVIYTPHFRPTTLTEPGTIEYSISQKRIIGISTEGNSAIPVDGYIIATKNKKLEDYCDNLQEILCTIELQHTAVETAWQMGGPEFIMNGAGLLISNGVIQTNEQIHAELSAGTPLTSTADEISANFHNEQERLWFIDKQHPRTAVGFTKDNRWLFAVVEGRQSNSSGMTLAELAQFMKDQGAVNALNMGGGGDSVMVINNQVVSLPSGASTPGAGYREQKERPVSDAFCIYSLTY